MSLIEGLKGVTTGRYQPRLMARPEYRAIEARIFASYFYLYGDLAKIKHFVFAIAYGSSFGNAIKPIAKTRGQHPIEIAAAYSMWQGDGL